MSEELIIDNFRLGNCVASGSSSQIYEAFDQETNERYAMKLLLDEAFKVPENRATLKREFKIASVLDHPNLMTVFAHRQTRNHAYMVMEFFGGPNLKQIIRGDAIVIHSRFRKMLECILLGLGQMHAQGWLHRDLKPDNIMMSKATDVRIIDFSLSSRIPSAMARLFTGKVKQIQGTRTYIAPEIVRRKLPTIQSDLYSLGVTVFECLTGRPPFMGSTPNDLLIKHIQEAPPEPSAFNPNITPEMDKLVLRMLAKKPENRPASTAELLSEFRSVKIFREDPDEFARQKAAIEDEKNNESVETSLDSRADAARQELKRTGQGGDSPVAAAQPSVPAKPATPKPAPAKPSAQSTPATTPNRPPAQQPPRPAQQPPGPQYPPGMVPPPQYQGMPPQGWPYGAQPPAPYPPPPGQPMQYPQQPAASKPAPPAGRPTPAGQQRPAQQAPKPAPPKPKPEDDLPFAEELPDIS